MKKLILYFLTSLACISITLVNIFAGGIDKLEVLSDGTVLRYVPSDNIEEVLEKYENLTKEISERNFSNVEKNSIRAISGILGALGYIASSSFFVSPSVVFGGKIVSLVSGVIGFLYPDYHEYSANKELLKIHSVADEEQYINMYSYSNILGQFRRFYEDRQKNPENYNSGLVIILRPAKKQRLGSDLKGPHSGVESQKVFKSTIHDNLIKAIELGW